MLPITWRRNVEAEHRYAQPHVRSFQVAVLLRGEPDRAPVQLGMHPVAVEFDFMEPVRPVRRLVDQSGELRF